MMGISNFPTGFWQSCTDFVGTGEAAYVDPSPFNFPSFIGGGAAESTRRLGFRIPIHRTFQGEHENLAYGSALEWVWKAEKGRT